MLRELAQKNGRNGLRHRRGAINLACGDTALRALLPPLRSISVKVNTRRATTRLISQVPRGDARKVSVNNFLRIYLGIFEGTNDTQDQMEEVNTVEAATRERNRG